MSDSVSVKVVTGMVRLSYAYLWEPKKQEDGSEKYSVQLIIPKSDKETLNDINNAIDKVIRENASILGKVVRKNLNVPLRDGDEEKPGEAAYKDSYFMNCSNTFAPNIVDTSVKPILDRREVYSGCYARVSLNFFPYNKKGNKGVGAGLRNVQKIKDGEPLGASAPKASDDFDAFGADDKNLEDYGFLD